MMKRIMILILMLIAVCPIKGADSSASGSQKPLGVTIVYEPLEVDSPDDKGKEEEELVCMVHLKRDGKEIVPPFAIALLDQCFAADLLSVAEGFVQGSDDKEAWVRSIFQDYTDDQIRLFVGALEHNSEDDASIWVNGLSNDDCISLIAIANCWDIKHIMQACQEQLARDITETDADALSGDVQYLLKDQLKQGLSDLNWYILKRLSFPSRDLFCISDLEDRQLIPSADSVIWPDREEELCASGYRYSLCNEQRLIFPTQRHVIIYEFATDSWTAIKIDARHDLDYPKEVVWASAEEDKILIRTDTRVIQYDCTTKTSKEFYCERPKFVRSAFGNVLIVGTHRGFFYNSKTGTTNIPFTDGEYTNDYWYDPVYRRFASPFFEVNDSNDIWFIVTRKHIIRCDKRTGDCKNIIIDNGEITNISFNKERLFIATDRKHMFLYDVQEDTIRALGIIVADNEYIESIDGFSEDGSHILIRTYHNNGTTKIHDILMYAIDEHVCKKIYSVSQVQDIHQPLFLPLRIRAYYIGNNVVITEVEREKCDLVFYNVDTEAINRMPVFNNRHCSGFVVEHASDKAILMSHSDCAYSYRFKENQVQRILLPNIPHFSALRYIHNNQALLVYTPHRVAIIPIPISFAQYEQFSLQQLQLLFKALTSWKVGKPYELTVDELDFYKSLPKELQTWQLFSTYCMDIGDNPMNPSMFMGDVTYDQVGICQVM